MEITKNKNELNKISNNIEIINDSLKKLKEKKLNELKLNIQFLPNKKKN